MLVVIAVKKRAKFSEIAYRPLINKAMVFTDYWEAYQAFIPNEQHLPVGKETGGTSPVERKNNTLRQHLARSARKMLSFSKCIIMHEICLNFFLYRHIKERSR